MREFRQHALDGGDQFRGREGLGQEGGEAGGAEAVLQFAFAVAADEQHWNCRGELPQLDQGLQPVLAGHGEVQHDDGNVGVGAKQVHGQVAILGGKHLEAGFFQRQPG